MAEKNLNRKHNQSSDPHSFQVRSLETHFGELRLKAILIVFSLTHLPTSYSESGPTVLLRVKVDAVVMLHRQRHKNYPQPHLP